MRRSPASWDALDKGIVMTSFFSPLGDTGIPTGPAATRQGYRLRWRRDGQAVEAAHPDKPIVMVQLGWPNHTEVKSGRTDPFVKGRALGRSYGHRPRLPERRKGPDAAKQIIKDLMTSHPEVNLIYSEASNLTVGTMAGLTESGRGKMDNGKPLTEIVASVDFDEVEYKEVYDPTAR